MTKKLVVDTVRDSILYDLDGLSIENAISYLRDVTKNLQNPTIEVEQRWDYCSMYIKYEREETEKEYQYRLKMEEKESLQKKKQEDKLRERELKELARLKAKYGDRK